jgi:hypothetical protein
MTPQEHMMMLLLLMKQDQSIKILINILTSRGVLTGDDARAFEFSQMQDAASNAAVFDGTKQKYLTVAKSLSLHTGLENLPEFPTDFFGPSAS